MMIRRIFSQANQLRSLIQSAMGLSPPQSSQRADLVRDEFGLHKMIVAVTSAGKVQSKNVFILFSDRTMKSVYYFRYTA